MNSVYVQHDNNKEIHVVQIVFFKNITLGTKHTNMMDNVGRNNHHQLHLPTFQSLPHV